MDTMMSIKVFYLNEDGAVTVDWVVLTAAIIGIGMIVLGPIVLSTNSVATSVGNYITSVPVGFQN
jgi:hypothetical protein